MSDVTMGEIRIRADLLSAADKAIVLGHVGLAIGILQLVQEWWPEEPAQAEEQTPQSAD